MYVAYVHSVYTCVFLWVWLSCIPGWPHTCCVAEGGLKLLLPLPPPITGYRYAPACLVLCGSGDGILGLRHTRQAQYWLSYIPRLYVCFVTYLFGGSLVTVRAVYFLLRVVSGVHTPYVAAWASNACSSDNCALPGSFWLLISWLHHVPGSTIFYGHSKFWIGKGWRDRHSLGHTRLAQPLSHWIRSWRNQWVLVQILQTHQDLEYFHE